MTVSTWKMVTVVVLVSVTVLLIAYDVLADLMGTATATESHRVYLMSVAHPIIAFAAGLLCGHLFWVQKIDSNETMEK